MYIDHLVLLVQCVVPYVHWLSCMAYAVCGARCALLVCLQIHFAHVVFLM